MNTSHHFPSRFAAAGLPVEVAQGPLFGGRGADGAEIVQLDITRDRRRGERFQIWPGASTNRIEAEGIDRQLRQLVLLVHEPARRFEVEVPRWTRLASDVRVVRTEGRRRWIEQRTDASKRHMLCGMDESHLFIAQLPRAVTTVRDAHRALRNPLVDRIERGGDRRTVRQGEWFFIALNPHEDRAVEELERAASIQRRIGIAEAARLNRRGRQHVADEVLVAIPRASTHRWLAGNVYVRGGVRHPDHKTVHFLTWRRVIGNLEPQAAVAGVSWVD